MVGESICSGDSGGPAFDMKTGAVIGVVSRGGNGAPYDPNSDPQYTECVDQGFYETQNLYTRTDGFKELIMRAFAEAGHEPWLEGQPDPRKAKFGEACAGSDACRSALCVGNGAAGICTSTCDEANVCPDNYTCQDAGGSTVCLPPPPPPTEAPAEANAASTGSSGGCNITTAPFDGSTCLVIAGVVALAITRRRRTQKP